MSTSLSERDRQLIWHPYTHQKYAADPIPIVRGEGTLLYDENGQSYIDATSSWWVNLHGHAHPYIAEKIYQQALKLEQVIFAGFTHEPAIELAERLLNILPGSMEKIFYSDNGSTATEVAIKMALQYWWNKGEHRRTKVLALTNSYHGDTFGAMSISERSVFTRAFQDKLFEVVFIPAPDNAQSSLPDKSLLEQTACIIYEPLLQGAGGMHMYEASALDALLQVCREHDVICIADEVLTGFGRTGNMFASQSCKNMPDIICLSKGLTGGTMALGVTACTANIYEAFVDEDKQKTFFHGHSFTANPIACSAALASLDLLLNPACQEAIRKIVSANKKFIEKLRQSNEEPGLLNIRQCGTVIAFEVEEKENDYNSSIKEFFSVHSLKKGVYLRPLGNTVYIMPPYCITPGELEKVYAVTEEILAELKQQPVSL